MAKCMAAQLGGSDGELGASLRYLSQRYTMPTGKSKGLTDRYRYRGTGTCRDDLLP